MANNGGQIRFGVGFDVDQSSLGKIKSSLKEIMNMKASDLKLVDAKEAKKQIEEIKKSAGELQSALQKSFNTDLGTLNVAKFNKELKALDLNKIQKNLSAAGTAGKTAFKDIATQALTTNMQLKQTGNILDKMGTTMMNTVKWGITSSIMNSFTGAVQEAFGYVKALDSSLTNVRIVTGQSSEEMRSFAVEANNAAAALGRQTKEYTSAALTYYQQGLNDKEVKARTEATLKAANITGESTEKMSEYLTSVWNGFQISNENAEDAVSKLAAVADSSASDMAELATGMSKVASTANSMGVSIDQLSAQIATIIATTRQAPESVGNALKTVYARIADIKAGTDDAEVSLGRYSEKMAGLGINVLDSAGELRDLGEVFEEIGGKWEGFNREQQIYLAQVMGGQRQYNQLISLFDNWTKYSDMLNISLNSQGAIDEKNAVYMESLEAHTKQLKAAQEDLMDSLINSDSWKSFIDFGTQAVKVLANFVDGIGGGGNALLAFGSTLTRVFSRQISNEISSIAINIQNAFSNKSLQNAQAEILAQFQGIDINSSEYQQILTMKQQELDLGKALTAEEHNQANEIIKATNNIQNQKTAWEANKEKAEEYLNTLNKTDIGAEMLSGLNLDLSKTSIGELKELDVVMQSQQRSIKETKIELNEYTSALMQASRQIQSNGDILEQGITNSQQSIANLKNGLKELGIEDETIKNKIQEIENLFKDGNILDTSAFQGKIKTLIGLLDNFTAESEKDAQQVRDAIKQALDGIENDINGKQGALDKAWADLINVGRIREVTNNIVSAAGAFGQLASAISAFKNLGNIWNNKDLSTGEKILQTVTNLGMTLPMLISSFGSLNKILGITNTLKTLFGGLALKATGAITSETIASGADATAKVGEAAATEGATVAQYGLNAAMAANPIGLVVMAIAGLVAAIGGIIAAYDAFTMSVEEANEALKAFDEKQKEVQQNTADFSKNVASLQAMSDEYDELSAKAGKYDSNVNQLTEDERNRYNEIKDLIVQYNEEAVVGYNAQGEAILNNNEALKETIELLKEKHQLEIDEIYSGEEFSENQRARGVLLTDARNRQQQLEARKKDFQEQGNGFTSTIDKTLGDENYQTSVSDDRLNTIASEIRQKVIDASGTFSDLTKEEQNALNELANIANEGVAELGKNHNKLLKVFDTLANISGFDIYQGYKVDFENLIQELLGDTSYIDAQTELINQEIAELTKIDSQELLGVLQTSENNELYNQLKELGLDNVDAIISAYVEGWQVADGAEYEDAFEEVLEKVKEKEKEWVKQLKDKKTVDEINKSVEEWTNSTFNSFQERTNDLAERINILLQKGIDPLLIQHFFGLDELNLDENGNFESFKDSYISQLNEVREEINKEYNQQMTMKGAQGIFDQEELENWDQIKEHIHMSTVESQGFVIAMREAKEELDSISHLESLNDILPTLSEGGELDLDEDQQAAYDKLVQDYEYLNELRLKGGHEYLEALRSIREQEEENAKLAEQRTLRDIELQRQKQEDQLRKLQLERDQRQDKGLDTSEIEVEIKAKTEELDATLAQYDDAVIAVNLAVDEDYASDIANSFDLADEIGYLQEQISSGLEISFDQAQAYIDQGWGAILQGAKETADQTIMLNEEVVNAFIDGKQEEIEANRQAKIDELEAEKALLVAKQQTLAQINESDSEQQMANALAEAKMLDQEVANTKAAYESKMQYAADADTQIGEAQSSLATYLQQVDADIAANAGGAAQSAAQSGVDASTSLVSAANEVANAWTNAWKAVGGEQVGAYQMQTPTIAISSTFQGQDTAGEYQAAITSLEDLSGEILAAAQENKDALYAAIQQEKESTEAEIGAIDGQIAALKSSSASLDKFQSGLGGSGGGGGGKSGGGKGSTPKEEKVAEPKHMDPFEDSDLTGTKSRFREIDQIIAQIGYRLEKIKNLQQRYLGSALVHNLNKQLKVLKEQNEAYKQKLSLAKQERASLQSQIGALGGVFGKDGVLTNSTGILQGQANAINNLINVYNGSTAAAQDVIGKQIDVAKQQYNNVKNLISQYEEINSLIPQLQNQIDQIQQQIIETKIQRFNAVIDLHIQWHDWEKKVQDFKKDMEDLRKNYSTIYINTATGSMTTSAQYGDIIEAATENARKNRLAEQSAALAKANLEAQYNADKKRVTTKKISKSKRKALEAEYGVDLRTKKQRKAFRQQLAENYTANLAMIDQQLEDAKRQAQEAFTTSFLGEGKGKSGEVYSRLMDAYDNANKSAAAAREEAYRKYEADKKKFDKNKKGKAKELAEEYGIDTSKVSKKGSKNRSLLGYAITDEYYDSLDEIERARQESINNALNEYYDAIDKVGDKSEKVAVDVFASFGQQIEELAKASDTLINGTILPNGERATSLVDDQVKHGLELAERIQRMNDNTKWDKKGNKIMGTDALKVGDVNPLTGEKIASAKQLKRVKKQISKSKSASVYADMQARIVEDGQKYAEQIQNTIQELTQQITDAYQAYYDAIQQTIDTSDDIIDEFEFINDLYEIQIKYAKAINNESLNLEDIEKNRLANRKAEIDFYKQRMDFYRDRMEAETIYSEEWKKDHEAFEKYTKQFYEMQLDYIEDLKDTAEDALDDIIKKFDKAATMNLGIDELSDRWEKSKEISDMYLNNLDKAYAIQKLQAKYQEAIDNTTDPTKQEQIRAIMEQQIKQLQEAEYLSQAEVDNAEALYDVTVKQIALEEAQRNKSKMRLRRDSQGNYTYQFVSDAKQTASAQQDLNDSLQKMNNDTTKALEENYNTQVKLFQDFISKLRDLREDFVNDEITKEEYEERLRMAQADFAKQSTITNRQNQRLTGAYQTSSALAMIGMAGTGIDEMFQNMGVSGEAAADINKFLSGVFSSSGSNNILSLLGNVNLLDIVKNADKNSNNVIFGIDGIFDLMENLPQDMLDNFENVQDLSQQTIDELINEGISRKEEIEAATETIISSLGDGGTIQSVIDLTTENMDAMKAILADGDESLAGYLQQIREIEAANLPEIGRLNDAFQELSNALSVMMNEAKYGSATGELGKQKVATIGSDTMSSASEGSTTAGGTVQIYSLKKNSKGKWTAKKAKDVARVNQAVNEDRGVFINKTKDVNGVTYAQISVLNEKTGKYTGSYWVRADVLKGYASGGYTGDWAGNEGKLAVLHKKEQVLNAEDTAKMFDAVKIAGKVADVVSSLGLARDEFATLGAQSIGAAALDQNVHISATFPNVSDHNEIEQALNNLINKASQYVNPSRRVS